LLAEQFLQRFARRLGRSVETISRRAVVVLKSYEWPGNVRELENVVERGVMLAKGKELRPEHLLMPGHDAVTSATAAATRGGVGDDLSVAELERLHVLAVLKRVGGNQKQAAQILEISKSTLWRKLKEYGVDASALQT
jgi:DNA-binding NtrC family response regulator